MYVFILQVTMSTWYTRLLWTEPMWTHTYARKSYNKQKWNNLGYKKTTNLKTTNLKIVRIYRCILPTIVTFIRGFMKIAQWVQTSVIKQNVKNTYFIHTKSHNTRMTNLKISKSKWRILPTIVTFISQFCGKWWKPFYFLICTKYGWQTDWQWYTIECLCQKIICFSETVIMFWMIWMKYESIVAGSYRT